MNYVFGILCILISPFILLPVVLVACMRELRYHFKNASAKDTSTL